MRIFYNANLGFCIGKRKYQKSQGHNYTYFNLKINTWESNASDCWEKSLFAITSWLKAKEPERKWISIKI